MENHLIDERNAVSEDTMPAYRVVFQEGTTTWTYRLVGCSVRDALHWASENAVGRTHELWVEHPLDAEPGMVTLSLLERATNAEAT
ncbi:MAG: hypothetical protein WBO89_11290 [Propionicimonas sp.]